jgi:hypothetical protein
MRIHLWHFTYTEAVRLIRKSGFKTRTDLNRHGNYFGAAGDLAWFGPFGPGLVEVLLEMDESEVIHWKMFGTNMWVIPDERVNACAVGWRFHERFDPMASRNSEQPGDQLDGGAVHTGA